MDLAAELLREHSRRQAERIASWVGGSPARYASLVDLFLRGTPVVTQRASWPLSICAERHPRLAEPHLRRLLARARDRGVHDAARRNVTRILQIVALPQRLLGEIATLCFDFLGDTGTPVAVKAYSMMVLARIVRQEPGLASELRLVIEQQLPFASPGFRACARDVLRSLP